MAGTNFFIDFPKVNYRFGSNELPVTFQDLSVYIDIFDQVAQYSSYYENYQIQNGERPDHVSYKLYERPDYHWTFYLLNEKLRKSSWPMDNFRLYEQAKQYYPYMSMMTKGSVWRNAFSGFRSMSTSDIFKEGGMIWFCKFNPNTKIVIPESSAIGRIIKIRHDLGQVIFELIEPVPSNSFPLVSPAETVYGIDKEFESKLDRWNTLCHEKFRTGENEEFLALQQEVSDLRPTLDFTQLDGPSTVFSILENKRDNRGKEDRVTPDRIAYEYDSIHHFENFNGEHVYPTYYKPESNYDGSFALKWEDMNTIQSVTYLERLQILNEEQRAIQVIKPDSISQVVREFKELLKN